MAHAIDTQATLGQLVTEEPARAEVFEVLGLDYCCGGGKTLAEACGEAGLNAEEVLQTLLKIGQTSADAQVDPGQMGLAELAEHIETTHHTYLHETLPMLRSMADKVADAHAERDARLLEVRQVLHALADEIEGHLMKEERVLFPAIRRLDAGQSLQGFACGDLSSPIQVMEMEHDNAGEALKRLHTLTGGYAVPEWACNTYRGFLAQLKRLETDLHQHIHKENNILFPRTLEREAGNTG